jgi:hypothetical protein
MSKSLTKNSIFFFLLLMSILFSSTTKAQFLMNSDSAFKAGSPNSGRIWGYVFGDFYYKGHADSLNRGGNNQYSGIPQSRNAFAFRRIYLGYDYNISKKFSTELLLAAEDNFPAFNPPSSAAASGDELSNSKETFFIKLANIRWKNIWKGTDLIVGEQTTPSFAMMSEKVWNYRSIERTISDIRRTPSYDMGAGLQGVFDPKTKNFGYNLLAATGNSDKPAANSFKWFYGDVYHWFFDKKLVVDFYADYQRLNWQSTWHHDRQMLKGFVAYNTQIFTLGVEGFINNLRGDTKATYITPPGAYSADTIATKASGVSLFLHGDIVKNKLRYFARIDLYNPNKNVDNNTYKAYSGVSSPGGYNSPGYKMTFSPSTGAPTAATSTGDPTAKETFMTFGLDYTPYKNIHFEPNIWYEHYASQLGATGSEGDHDLVFRLTFFFVFGKSYNNTYNQF